MADLPALRKQALEKKEKTPKEVIEYIRALSTMMEQIKQQDVRSLTEDQLFTIRDEHGQIRAVKKFVYLSYDNKGLTLPIQTGPYVISASGYTRLNSEAGVSVISPKTVYVGGKQMPNPYVERDDNGRPITVHSRKVAFGFSPMGQPKTADRTILYDASAYRLVDLFSKAAYNKDAFVLQPKDGGAPDRKGSWAKYSIDEAVDLWVNTYHPDVLKWYQSIIVRERKIVDVAQTFAERNASKAWHGLDAVPGQIIPGQRQVRQINEWWVPVICWRADSGIIHWDGRKYEALQDRIEQVTDGHVPADDGHSSQQITVEAGVDRVDGSRIQEPDEYQDEPIEIGGGIEDIEPPIPDPNETAPFEGEFEPSLPEEYEHADGASPSPSDDDAKVIKQTLALKAAMPEAFSRAMNAYGYLPETLTADQARQVMKDVQGGAA